MFPLPESFKAFMFQTGVDRICEAYRASVDTMERAQREAEETAANYEASGADDDEYDDDGILIHSTRHSLEHDQLNASLAITVVREAFITSVFHYWERSARGWTQLYDQNSGYIALSKAAVKMYSISPKLDTLNMLNNVLKHDSEDKAKKLAGVRPDYFSSLFPVSNNSINQRLVLRIRHEHVEEAFETVRASGPTYAV